MLSPNARAPKERIFRMAVRPKKEKKGLLDKYLINGPPNVRAYDNLLVITRGTLEDHLEKLRGVIRRLREAELKVSTAKSFFCTHKIEYLGYILTREGIKPQPKKVQIILALNPPNNVKELRHFLGMVQYYRDM
jgi:hypothetical protein